jgi:hypothetical protein
MKASTARESAWVPAVAVDVAVIRREFTSAADARRQGAVPGFGRFSRMATDVVF